MSWHEILRRRFESAGRSVPDEVLAEIAGHADDLATELRGAGMPEDEVRARVEALAEQWSHTRAAVRSRARRPAPAPPETPRSGLAGLGSDVRYAVRVLSRRPGPTLLAASTIATGIAAVTIVASLAWSTLFKPLPWPDSGRLVRLVETRQGTPSRFGPYMTNASWFAWREKADTIDAIGGWRTTTATLAPGSADREAVRVMVASITTGIQTMAGARPALGRLFAPADEQSDGARVAILSYEAWVSLFGGRPDVIGRTIRLDGDTHTVVGVLEQGCYFPDRRTALWVPLSVEPVVAPGVPGHRLSFFHAMARLKPGATPARAASEATARARTAPDPGMVLIAVFGNRGPAGVLVEPAQEWMAREVRSGLLVMLAAVGLLLACAVANVANVQLTRAASRRREMGIRAALGAGGGRLARQLFVEHLLLGAAGSVIGIALARAALHLLPRLLPASFPRIDDLAFDWPVAWLALACAAGAGLVVGALPALQVRRLDLVGTLAEDGLAPAGAGMRLRATRLRAAAMIAQVAAATVLLVGGALLTRSFVAVATIDRGFDTAGVLTATVPLPNDGYTPQRRTALFETLVTRLRQVPGVRAAGFTSILPLSGSESIRAFEMRAPRGAPSPTAQVQATFRVVSPGYFAAVGRRMLEGRALNDGDTATSRHVVVVNRAFARAYLDSPAVGRLVPAGRDEATDWGVVGVVDNVRSSTADPALPEMLVSYRQWPDSVTGDPGIAVRTDGNAAEFGPLVRGLLRELDPSLALADVRTMDDRVSEVIATPRLYSMVVGGFAALALLIAGVGLFGVLSYAVAQRSRELAVRAALGAGPGRLIGMVLAQGLVLVSIGLAIGYGVALLAARSLASLLYGVTPHDPVAFVAVAALLLAAGAAACFVPAAKAARATPMALLRRG